MTDYQVKVSPFDWAAGAGDRQAGMEPKRVREAASQFESLLIAQMLSSMRQSDGGGWLGCGDDQAGATMTEMAEQCVAQSIAASGGLGLAPIVERGLTRASEAAREPSGPPVIRRR